ncbi:hypothetical protein GGR89_002862 [Sphingomonas trueperi]|uniref:Uncharacterized protein n=1 Tax=Sphingomonas trueperi TaxID=53317 RepID=A0A7X5Y005_9SPHN|nr:hypothetical protein [Sphingomonas trueperi]
MLFAAAIALHWVAERLSFLPCTDPRSRLIGV